MAARWLARILVLAGVLGPVLMAGPALAADWVKDWGRYHASAHGQLSCADCHGDITPGGGHPDPAAAAQDPRARFQPQRCYECHSDIEGSLAQGRHGRRAVTDPARYARCITCHDPHYVYHREPDLPGEFSAGQPRWRQCAACHERQEQLPPPGPESQACLACHGAGAYRTSWGETRLDPLCLSCHGRPDLASSRLAVLAGGREDLGPHGELSCLACHKGAAGAPHTRQELADCLACHQRHDEAEIADAHIGVSCAACHLGGLTPRRERPGGPVTAGLVPAERPRPIHALVDPKSEESCRRCHFPGNQIGAVGMVLPPKGLLCMPCHTATFTLEGTASQAGLAVFAFGLIAAIGFWRSGAKAEPAVLGGHHAPQGGAAGRVLTALVLDGLLQRRLWRYSPLRGLIHNLIFLPFVVRFTWGLAALLASLWAPGDPVVISLLDKNAPLTALVFDLTGVMVLVGVAGALARRLLAGGPAYAHLPRPDWPALGLLLGIIVVGFVAEAMRIALTGFPDGSSWAFLGHALAGAFAGSPGLEMSYGYIWYAHAILTACFAAYLPFSRMFHIIMAPVTLALRAARGRG